MAQTSAARNSLQLTHRATLRQLAAAKLSALCDGLGMPHLRDRALPLFDLMSSGWNQLPALAAPYWPSDITDDGSPFEFSVAFASGKPELRMLIEPQLLPASVESNWRAGLEVNSLLARDHGAELGRFERIQSLFAPKTSDQVRFSFWHSAAFDQRGRATFKAYLNPAIGGASQAPSTVHAALQELGFSDTWNILAACAGETGQYLYFSLDLVSAESARVKVYVGYEPARLDELVRSLREAGIAEANSVENWVAALTGGRAPLDGRGLQVCYAFRAGSRRPGMTLYVPVRSFCASDQEALARAATFLKPAAAQALTEGVERMAGRRLEVGRGLITYVALRSSLDGPGVTAYLSPEVYSIASARPAINQREERRHSGILARAAIQNPSATSFSVVLNAIEQHREALSSHPFLTYLRSESGTLEDVQCITGRIAFFVMCFQDVLRLVHSTTADPLLKRLAKVHQSEDSGHDNWYLHDLERFGISLGLRDLFSARTALTRDVAYTQISDVLRATDDCSRLGVVLALEAAGREFFQGIIEFIERQQRIAGLLYFARRHQRIEQNHDMFTGDAQDELEAIMVSADALTEILAVVARTFETMTRLADDLLQQVKHRSPMSVTEDQGVEGAA